MLVQLIILTIFLRKIKVVTLRVHIEWAVEILGKKIEGIQLHRIRIYFYTS
jgi:hypothetical protein